MSASRDKPWRRFIKRDIVQGGGRGKVQRTFRGEAAYVKRLRRIEVVLLHITAKLTLGDFELDSMLQLMLDLEDVVEPKPGRRGPDDREAVPVPQVGAPSGESEGNLAAAIRARVAIESEDS